MSALEPIQKASRLLKAELNEEELDLINAQALRPMTAEEVFTFRLAACDDQIDRDNERFTPETLDGFAKLFPGRTVLMDHDWDVKNQTARVYAASVEEVGGVRRLVLRCYMPRLESNADTIRAIESGILRECSVGVAVKSVICSICGQDQRTGWCEHVGGREYGGQVCYFELTGAADVYEVSMVAVPAQREAGVIKSKRYGGPEGPESTGPDWQDKALLELERYRI